ncbi:MAG TPA: DNA mismatch repair protein MutS, partial [Puia sp.]
MNLKINSPLGGRGMEIDKVTYEDLSVFNREEEFSIFHKLNFTRTVGGKVWLYQFLTKPFSDLKQITETQKIISLIIERENEWPLSISNGTIMVMEKFYETSIDEIPASHDVFNAFIYQFFHKADHSLVKYTISHFQDFVKGMNLLIDMFDNENSPILLRSYLQRARSLLSNELIISLNKTEKNYTFPALQVVSYGNYIRARFKSAALELIDIYSRLDAWYSMAMATKEYNLTLPKFFDNQQPCITANGLYHILLPEPVAYDIQLNQQNNFLFLTGANMAGKSTFIKAVGIAVYLAHLGMGVPAQKMELSLFDGVLSN